ncbi:MAG: hypothetical protein EOP86_12000, partial [Verrucomicrobiaceae bacterium]
MKNFYFPFIALLPAIALSEEKPKTAKDFDLNRDGMLSVSEKTSYYLDKKNPAYKDLESDGKSGVTDAEIQI